MACMAEALGMQLPGSASWPAVDARRYETAAEAGIQAVALVESLAPDLVLMDIAMPVLDGIAATRRIRELVPSSSVVILTGSDSPQGDVIARAVGASGYVRKTSDLPGLVSVILALATLAARPLGEEAGPVTH